MNAREKILEKLRAAAPPIAPPVPAIGDAEAGLSPVREMAQELARRLRAMRAEVIETNEATWPQALASVVSGKSLRTVLFGVGAPTTKLAVGAMPPNVSSVLFDRPIEAWKGTLFSNVDAGFTEADCALANVGALVMRTGPNEPRTLSLVPATHVILIRASRIFPDMPSAARRQGWAANMPTNLVMVSGPSKTSDIQQTLAFGAHGPKELVVLLVEDTCDG